MNLEILIVATLAVLLNVWSFYVDHKTKAVQELVKGLEDGKA